MVIIITMIIGIILFSYILKDFDDLRIVVAKFGRQELRTYFHKLFQTEKQAPQTFLLLEYMDQQ